jgi:predicted Zn-dependent peptidase
MKAMVAGDFTEEEMSQTKAVIKNQYLETIDTARGTVEIMYHNIVAGKKISFEDLISKIDIVTKDEIMKVAGKIELDTIYFLTEEEQ